MVQRFKTRIVEIEAVRFNGYNEKELNVWTEGKFRLRTNLGLSEAIVENGEGPVSYERYGEVFDYLHDTWIRVTPGQWIVRGAKGEFYPCDDETFHWKYEEIVDPDFTMTGTLEYRDGEVTAEGFEVTASSGHVQDFEPVDPKDVIKKVIK